MTPTNEPTSPRERYESARERLSELQERLSPVIGSDKHQHNVPVTPDVLEDLVRLESEAEAALVDLMDSAERTAKRQRRARHR